MTEPHLALDLIRCVALRLDKASRDDGSLIHQGAYKALADDLWRAFSQVEGLANAAYRAVDAHDVYSSCDETEAIDQLLALGERMLDLEQGHLCLNFGRPEFRTWTNPIPGGWT